MLDLSSLFLLLFGLLAAGLLRRVLLLLMHNEPCPTLFLVPLEASEVGLVELIVRL